MIVGLLEFTGRLVSHWRTKVGTLLGMRVEMGGDGLGHLTHIIKIEISIQTARVDIDWEEVPTLNIALQIETCGGSRRFWRTIDYLVHLVDVHPVAVEHCQIVVRLSNWGCWNN
jgi:hypothetical protein